MKNIIITGANQGIGYYMLEQLLLDGYNVTVLDLYTDNLSKLGQKYSTLFSLVCDIRNDEQVNRCVKESVEKFGTIDCAIHNACLCTFESMEDTDKEVYQNVFDVNYFGALNLTKAVVPYMKKRNTGKVIFTSSGVGVTGFINISAYASSKAAIETLAKCLNLEYQNKGISFHIFHPPLTNTQSAHPLPIPKEFMADPKKVGVGLARNISKKRFIICHSLGQQLQTLGCYLMPLKLGRFMSKMTINYKQKEKH